MIREGIMGEKGEGFTGTIIKAIWTITRGGMEMGEGVRDSWGGGKNAENCT